jgi:hypothetical protein
LLPGFRLVHLAQRLLAEQPDPPRRVSLRDVLEIHAPTLVYALVGPPAIFVIYVTVRSRQPLPLDVTAKSAGLIVLVMVIFMTLYMVGLRKSLREGVAATGEILTATRTAGRLRVNIKGRSVDKAYRSGTFEKFAPGTRITVLLDPRKDEVLLTLGRADSDY